jgi:cell fate regulator YaaT (PSP1 superfamily)
MIEIIGVRFKNTGKVYYFDPAGEAYQKSDHVIVETARGMEIGEVLFANRKVGKDAVVTPLKPVVKRASDEDFQKLKDMEKKKKDAFDICQKKIREHKLEMKLIDVEYTFDGGKILFYFTADGRIDFRELVKSLATVFRTRIELRQIGVRDEAKMLGGLGVCGRELCCRRFLGDFEPVSIKMAKEQGLSLNPSKISGTCGRLMCCLKYEQATYEHLLKHMPKTDAVVKTPDGKGVVADSNILTGKVKVRLDKDDGSALHSYDVKDLVIIRNAAIKLTPQEIAELKKLEDEK